MINSTSTYLDIKASRPVPVRPVVAGGQDRADGAAEDSSVDAKRSASPEQVLEAAKHVAERLQSSQRTLQFSVDSETRSTVVKVIDSETNTVIRQIPSEELLSISKRLEAATGVLVNDTA